MFVRADSLGEEIRVTIDAAMELANVVTDDEGDLAERLHDVLVGHDFVRASGASSTELDAFVDRSIPLARLFASLPDLELVEAVTRTNAALESCAIVPSLSSHDGFALHIHWTPSSTPFAHQVAVDLLMGLAQTLCDHGIGRFGRCAADGCEHVFYDTTKNRSRRFCSDQRCASRTHTAAHRARRSRDD